MDTYMYTRKFCSLIVKEKINIITKTAQNLPLHSIHTTPYFFLLSLLPFTIRHPDTISVGLSVHRISRKFN